ncbi:MAG TPA: serine hydrolase [Thermotogota bacterium]|nr:serine hydrolase [Thermotogota bacterium]
MKKLVIFMFFVCCLSVAFSAQQSDLNEVLQTFRDYALQVQQKWGIPGMAVGVVRGDEVLFTEAFGYRSVEMTAPVDLDTTFQIGSTSKAFTSFLVAKAVQDGLIKWTDKVRDHYPDFELYDPYVTANMEIRDLMAQHSGLAPYSGDLTQMMGYSPEYLIERLKYIRPMATFRTDFTYVNSLFLVAGKIVENIAGQSYEELLQRQVFDPLGMEDTGVSYEKHVNNENRTITHVFELMTGDEPTEISVIPIDCHAEGFEWSYHFAPAGGIDSSLADMVEWLKLHVNDGCVNGKQLIAPQYLNRLYQPATLVHSNKHGQLAAYCQGWVYETVGDYTMIWHNGSTVGSKTMIAFFPELDTGIVILTNMGGMNFPDNLTRDFLDLLVGNPFRQLALKEVDEVLSADIPVEIQQSEASPAMSNEAYTGLYFNEVYGEMEVYAADDKLFIRIGPNESVIELRHVNRDTFDLFWDVMHFGEMGRGTFRIDAAGYAVTLSIDLFEEEGSGVFTRIK